jgi:stearoyl-CoA desaturase (delta-9 desaturase)
MGFRHKLEQLLRFKNDYEASLHIPDEVDWIRAIPFILVNLSCLLVFVVGFSWVAFITALGLFFIREFSITAFYHRYFSHQTFKTNRFWQCVFAIIGCAALQKGPIWWASHHRQHHLVSDMPEDVHSPKQHGFWWSHMGWILSKKHYYYNPALVEDLEKYPELVFLNRYDILVPAILVVFLFFFGWGLQVYAPQLQTNPAQMIVWGFCISTVALFHCTFFINSLCHVWGTRRYATNDTTKNNLFLALLTLGEGWHNNHHHYPASTRQGFMWWEIDITYYVIKLLALLGIVWDIRPVPPYVLTKRLIKKD